MGGFTLQIEKLGEISIYISNEHGFGTDAFLLANFACAKRGDKVCDLGTGCGIIPLLMCKWNPPKKIVAIDIQERAIRQLELSVKANSLGGIIRPIHADLRALPLPLGSEELNSGRFELITCNPPYKRAGSGITNKNSAHSIARHEIMCNIDDVCSAANKLLKFGGRLCICQRPERLADVITAMKSNGIEPKKIRFVSKNPHTEPWLFLIEGRKGGSPFMRTMPQLYIREGDGFTEELQAIYGSKVSEEF